MKEKAVLIQLFLRLCGAPANQAANLSGAELTLRHASALGWVIPLALALAGLTWWSYRRDTREVLTRARRHVLTALRIGLLSLLLLVLLQPVLTFTIETSIRSTVEAELWSSPAYFLLIVLVASTEWVLRKRWDLK